MSKKSILIGVGVAAAGAVATAVVLGATLGNNTETAPKERVKVTDGGQAPEEGEKQNTGENSGNEVKEEYTISYVANNGSEQVSSRIKKNDHAKQPENPKKSADARAKYVFVGWYTDNESFKYEYNFDTPITGDVTLYAKYEEVINQYTVNFVVEGNLVSSTVLDYGAEINSPVNPIKSKDIEHSYEFVGWYTDDNANAKTDLGTVTGDVTYYAKFSNILNSYNVRFMVDNDVVLTENMDYGSAISAPTAPTKANTIEYTYNFLGWSLDKNGTVVTDLGNVAGDVTYYAIFEEIKNNYNITFVDNGVVTSETLPYGTIITKANPSNREENGSIFEFVGWSLEENGDIISDLGTVDGEKTFYAVYNESKINYKVTYIVDGVTNSMILPYGSAINLVDPTKAKTAKYTYEFIGWSLEENGDVLVDLGTVDGEKTFYAVFNEKINKYNVSYYAEDGKTLLYETMVEYGQKPVYEGEDPKKDSELLYVYTFNGWNEDIVTGDKSYVATFKKEDRKYNITWINNGDVVRVDNDSVYGTTYGDINESYIEEGIRYVFSGWNEVINGNDITRTAKYETEKINYTITWKNEDGTVIKTDSLKYGDNPTIDLIPTKEANKKYTYVFSGWSPAVSKVISDQEYVAVYDEIVNEYAIKFIVDGVEYASNNCAYDSNIIAPINPAKEATTAVSYEFIGWSLEENGDALVDLGTVDGDKTFYAVFKENINNYNVTFVVDGILYTNYNLEYGKDIVLPIAPTKANTKEYTYEFIGWSLEENGDIISDLGTVDGNKTFYAIFNETVNTYDIKFINGSTVISSNKIAYGNTIEAPSNPKKESTAEFTYEFIGWALEENGTILEDLGKVDGAKVFYAVFNEIKNTYDVNFIVDGLEYSSSKLEYGKAINLPLSPKKESTAEFTYEFIGWALEENGVVLTDLGIVDGEKTFYAIFNETVNTYDIKFINGSTIISSNKIAYGNTIEVPSNPKKESTAELTYEFIGWSLEENGAVLEDLGKVNGEKTFYAVYNAITNEYNYKFYNEDGSLVLRDITAKYGTEIVAPEALAKDGNLEISYEFDGWYTSLNGGEKVTDFGTLTGNSYYYARYKEVENKYTIYWNNYNNVNLKTDTNAKYSTKYTGETPTKELNDGKTYNFDKWIEVVVDNTITRTASFNEAKANYKVTWLNEDGTLLKIDTVESESLAVYGVAPTKNGYRFIGWMLNGELYDLSTPVTNDITLKAAYAEVIQVGFGASYTPWKQLVTEAGASVITDSKNRYVLNTNVSYNNFTFINNDKNLIAQDYSNYNNQGAQIIIELTNTSSIVLNGTWASTTSKGVITVKNQNGDIVYESNQISGSGTNVSFRVDDLAKGTYTIDTQYSVNVTSVFYETIKEYVTVKFADDMFDSLRIVKGTKIDNLPVAQKDNYKFEGWYTNASLTSLFDVQSPVNSDIVLYPKFTKLTEEEKATVTFVSNVAGQTFDSITVLKNSTIITPTKDIDGYRFIGWYLDENYNSEFVEGLPIPMDMTLYGLYVKQWTITYLDMDGNVLSSGLVDDEVLFGEVVKAMAPYVEGYSFDCWYNNDQKFDDTMNVESDLVLTAHYVKDSTVTEKVAITREEGLQETAYIEFNQYKDVKEYAVFELKNNNPVLLSEKQVYLQKTSKGYRADIFGLTEGTHKFIVSPVISGTEAVGLGSQATVEVEAYDRSGFAHYNTTTGVGAYNNDGTLKDNAIVLYVTDENKNTVELTYGGITVKGIGNILNSAGKDVGGGVTSKGGIANTNQGIIRKLAEAGIPLVVRFVGCVSNTGLYEKGTFKASSTPKIDGLTHYNSVDYGGSVKDNGHMARIQSGKDITIEGVGSNATIDGFGFHLVAESSAPDFAKSFEVRNLKFINTPEDAIGMEGVQEGSTLVASVERCWVHNNEFYCPNITDAAESDKSEGDGSVDFKRGQYFTCSYNYFEGCHKTNLVGASDSNLQFNLTYHHNFWYMCKARGPLARQANIHMYNNLFYGQTDYAMNTRANSYIYSEYNMFYACKNPYVVDSGAIKSFNDSVASALIKGTSATIVTDRNTKVSSSCANGGISYSSFELDPNLSYIANNDYELQTDLEEARKVIFARGGTANDSLTKIGNVSMNDISVLKTISPSTTVEKITLGNSPVTVTPGKTKKIYAFELTSSASVTLSYASEADTATGVLCNEAGIALLKGSGTVKLTPGVYLVQCYNIEAGDSKTLTQPTFKETTINSITFNKIDDTEYQNQLIAEFNNLVNALPSNIEYNNTCYEVINAAFNKYESLPTEAKSKVATNYAKLNTAYSTYKNKGIAFVEGEINKIVTPVNESNADYVYAARSAYNELLSKVSDASISNYSNLLNAEASLESLVVTIFINKVNALPTIITYDNATLDKIVAAENAYEALSSEQRMLDDVKDAYDILLEARAKYNELEVEANKITVTFVADGLNIDPIRIQKNTSVTIPNIKKAGYRVAGYYTNSSFTNEFNTSTKLLADTTIYVKFVKQCTVTFLDMNGNLIDTSTTDYDTLLSTVPTAPYVSGYKFSHWSLTQNGSEYKVDTIDVVADITVYAVYKVSDVKTIEIRNYGAEQETMYAEFNKFESFTDYNAYIKPSNSSTYIKLDKQLIRLYKDGYYRVDAVGIKAGTYDLKIVAVNGNNEIADSASIITANVVAHERTGFGFVNGSSSGAYNDDGTLKSNAAVLYVANSNKDTITYAGFTGISAILTGMKAQKYISNPVCIRFIGNIEDPANMSKGDLYLDDVKDLTVEGIGTDATLNGFGIVIKNSTNVEIRNLGFMNCNSSEGDDCGLQQSNNHVWVHNCDFFYGDAGSDADQAKGDGALDTKTSTYITHSYNHFWDNGKCNLQGMKSESTNNYITYHHNWYDHSDSRHPRIRTCTVHIYNNYFDGNAKYGVGMTMGGSAFVENNYFRTSTTMKPMLISMQGTDALGAGTFSGEAGGVIKSYGNVFDGNASFIPYSENNTSFDAYDASSRDEKVPSSVKSVSGGTTYNNFDTDSSLMYSYNVQTAEAAKETVIKYAGRTQGGDFKWTFNNETEDSNYGVISGLKDAIVKYSGKLSSVLGLSNQSSGGSTTPTNPDPVDENTADDVIALINALPSSSNVTASDKANIMAAKAAYDALSQAEKDKVTNYSKLVACMNALPQTAEVCSFPYTDSFFSVTGSTSTSKGSVTYEGTTYGTCLKVESKTNVSFTTTKASKLIIVLDANSTAAIKVDGTEYKASAGIVTVNLGAGSHSITKKDTCNIFYISVE